MTGVPFVLRRPWLLVRDLFVDRDRPDLERLGAMRDPEGFVWAILPHAARTFSACIALLPAQAAKAAAVAYLYCRILDTYEDLMPGPAERDAALTAFAARLDAAAESGAETLAAAPAIQHPEVQDVRDRAHLLLVERCELVDRVFLSLRPGVRPLIRDLVRDMAGGMCWSSARFADQQGVLRDEDQVTAYCRHVLGNPVVFTMRLLQFQRTGSADLTADEHHHFMRSGELIQLANVTRDIEKDLRRGVAYRPELAGDLGRDPPGDMAATERVRRARLALFRLAMERAASYRAVVDAMARPLLSPARASALLMLLFTDRYYRGCARRAGLAPWGGRPGWAALVLRSLPGIVSRSWAGRVTDRVVADFERAAAAARAAETAG